MKTIEYADDGEVIADMKCEERARAFLTDPTTNDMKVASSVFVYAIRALVYEGLIDHNQVCFLFNGEYLYLDKGARSGHWPSGFCDVSDGFLKRLLAPTKEWEEKMRTYSKWIFPKKRCESA